MATTTEEREARGPRRNAGYGWVTGASVLALVAVMISATMVFSPPGTRTQQDRPTSEPVEMPTVAAQPSPLAALWCDDELEVVTAVHAGLMPRKVLLKEPFRTTLLIAQGFIPREAAEPCD